MEVSLLTAFLGGVLALLSPCAALLMPAFFASAFGSGARLLLHGAIFYVGLALVLVPVGMGAGAVGALFTTHRQAIILAASLLLIVLGMVQLLGFGFDPARLLPGSERLQSRATTATGASKTFLLGAASGVAGFCAGPVLGAVLTLAATSGNAFAAGGLLAVYAAGMVAPLLLIAAVWRRLGNRGQRLLRGRSFPIGSVELHTTSVLTGLLLIAVGVLFWTTNGLVTAPALLPTDMQAWLQSQSARLANPVLDVAVAVAVAAIVLAIWWGRHRRSRAVESEAVETRAGKRN